MPNIIPALQALAVSIASLHPDPANARKHNDKNLDAIKASLAKFGQRKPVVVQREGMIVRAGNGTLAAAKALGWTEVAAVVLDDDNATASQFAIADNRTAELAEWDNETLATLLDGMDEQDRELLGFDADDMQELIGELTPEIVEDEVPEPPAEPITKPGDLWLLGYHRLLCGDSTKAEDVARLMNGEKAACVFTSPPYGVGIDYGETYSDTIDNLRKMLPKLAATWVEIVQDGGFAVVNFGDIVSGKEAAGSQDVCEYPMATEYWPAFRSAGWALWSRRVWCKPVARVAAPWCASSNRSATNYEHVWTWKKSGKPIVGRVGQPMDSQTGWFDTSRLDGVDVGKETHGAGMPTSCAAWMLNVHSLHGGLVHEPFCGTGTTLIAAEQLGRKCYGMEISPAYCDVIVKRWETLTGKKAVLADG